jgi:hypothetical protein
MKLVGDHDFLVAYRQITGTDKSAWRDLSVVQSDYRFGISLTNKDEI